jgi:predicted anti-sigma-YlaC factor YlaD
MNCEDVRMSAMAAADGEAGPLPREAVREHVSSCEACRLAIAQMSAMNRALDSVQRQQSAPNLWPAIESRLANRSDSRALVLLAVLLAIFKIVEFAPARDFGTWLQLAPLIIATSVFAFLKQNPFQINAGLRHGGEEL